MWGARWCVSLFSAYGAGEVAVVAGFSVLHRLGSRLLRASREREHRNEEKCRKEEFFDHSVFSQLLLLYEKTFFPSRRERLLTIFVFSAYLRIISYRIEVRDSFYIS